GSTSDMIFTVRQLVSYVSRFMSLRAGDILSTGTPAGVAHGMKPPRYLQPGDVVEMGITGLGTQKNRIVARYAPLFRLTRGASLVQRLVLRRHGTARRLVHGLVSGTALARHGHDSDHVPLGAGGLPLHPGSLLRGVGRPTAAMTEPDVTLTDVGLAIECGIL